MGRMTTENDLSMPDKFDSGLAKVAEFVAEQKQRMLDAQASGCDTFAASEAFDLETISRVLALCRKLKGRGSIRARDTLPNLKHAAEQLLIELMPGQNRTKVTEMYDDR